MTASGIVGGPTENPRIREVLGRRAAQRGIRFVWDADRVITYTGSRGAWHSSTRAINGRDDEISVHPGEKGLFELERVADAGHVEVERLEIDELSKRLQTTLDWFDGWARFFGQGPGPGH